MIKKEEVQHIAKLARLGLNEAEIRKFQKNLSSILDYFNSLKEVDVSGIEPTFHPSGYLFEKKFGVMREDKAESQPIEIVNKLVEATPPRKKRYIKVKTVL